MRRLVAGPRSFGAVVWREWVALRYLFVAAVALGLMAPLAGLMSTPLGVDAESARDMTAIASALCLGLGTLGALGYSTVAPDVATGRLGFYLARPISASALWFGKLTARFTAAAAAAGLVLVPSLALGGQPISMFQLVFDAPRVLWRLPLHSWGAETELFYAHWTWFRSAPGYYNPGDWTALGIIALVVFCLGHFFGCSLRLRGLWTLFDVTMAVLLPLFAFSLFQRFLEIGALTGRFAALVVPAAVAVAVLLLGGIGQLRWGRRSPTRFHGVLSVMLLLAVGGSIFALDRWAGHLEDLKVRDADSILDVTPARQGPWAVMTGIDTRSGAARTWVVNTETGQELGLGPRMRLTQRPRFAAEGQDLFFWRCEGIIAVNRKVKNRCGFYHLDLRRDVLTPRRVPLEYHEMLSHRMALAPDGSKIAIQNGGTVLAVDVSGRLLWRQQLPDHSYRYGGTGRVLFRDSDSVLAMRARKRLESDERWGDPKVDRQQLSAEIWLLDEGSEPSLLRVVPWSTVSGTLFPFERFVEGDSEERSAIFNVSKGYYDPLVNWTGTVDESIHEVGVERVVEAGPDAATEFHSPRVRARWLVALRTERDLPGYLMLHAEPAAGTVLVTGAVEVPPIAGKARWILRRTHIVDVESKDVLRTIDGYAGLPLPRRPGEQGADWLVDNRGFPFRLDLETGELEPILRF
ncbi:MAG: hypothetical protein AAGM22_22615 [Acidobacteriota bacterium]